MNGFTRLEALRREFLNRTAAELTALSEVLASAEALPASQKFVSVVHRIAGTGFSLQFDGLAEQARALELTWRALPAEWAEHRSLLQTQVLNLLEICHVQ